jgi:formyl-CoA transferase
MCSVLAGPYAGALLQRLGAEVIKIESPNGGDPFRNWSIKGSPHFTQFNIGKQSVVVDLADARGVGVVRELLPTVDILIHNSRPGRMEGLGLSGPECLSVNARLVFVSMSGFGQQGPMASRPAYDAIGQAASGLLGLLAPGGPPSVVLSFGDMATGILGAAAAMAGYASVLRTGVGVLAETSMLESVIALIADAFTQFGMTGQQPTEDSRGRQSQVFSLAGSDGRYVVIHLSSTDKFFRNLVNAIGREDLATDPRFASYADRMANYPALRSELAELLVERSSTEWEELLVAADVPVSVVRSVGELLDDPQIKYLELFNREEGPVPLFRSPWSFGGVRPPLDTHVAALGEHTRSALKKVLADDTIEALHDAGVIRTVDDYVEGETS